MNIAIDAPLNPAHFFAISAGTCVSSNVRWSPIPVVWESRYRIVIAPIGRPFNFDKWLEMGSSRPSWPVSTDCMTKLAVKLLASEAMPNRKRIDVAPFGIGRAKGALVDHISVDRDE